MAGILDYLGREFSSFAEKPLGTVDSVALSQFCMVDGGGVVPPVRARSSLPAPFDALADRLTASRVRPARFADLLKAERFDSMFTGLAPDFVREELVALAASPRFRALELRDYASVLDEGSHTQFAAVTFVLPGEFAYVGFRGTDVSFAGWRENFDMTYLPSVPAQTMAADYLASVARHLPERLYVGGHSKGGNLALYAALTADSALQARIERVFCHDAPGFKHGLFSEEEYAPLAGRIDKTLPQGSIVGVLMEYLGEERVVKSSARGLMEHSVFTWEVEGDDLVCLDRLSDGSLFMREVLSEWLDGFSDDETRVVVEALFRALEASGAEHAGDIFGGGKRALGLLADAAKNADEESRDVLARALGQLTAVAVRRFGQDVARSLPFLR